MLHICTAQNRSLYRAQMKEIHAQRYELFVKTKGWNLQVRDGGEYDQGDDERAVYLMSLDEFGRCFGSIRVRPADDFSMVIDIMPEFVHGDAKALRDDPDIWEMARWINIGQDRRAAQEVRIGMVEYLLSRGASQCLALPDVSTLQHVIRAGSHLQPIGAPRQYPEGGTAVAVSLPITAAVVARMREVSQRDDIFLMEVPADADWSDLPLPVIERAYRDASAAATSTADMAQTAARVLGEERSHQAA